MRSRSLVAALLILVVLVSGCIGGKSPATSTPSRTSTTNVQTSAQFVPPWEYKNAKVIRGESLREVWYNLSWVKTFTGNISLSYSNGIVTVNFTGIVRGDSNVLEVMEEVPDEKPSAINVTVILNGKTLNLTSSPIEVYAYPKMYNSYFGRSHSGWLILYRIPVNGSVFHLTVISKFNYRDYTSSYNPELALFVPVLLGAVPVVEDFNATLHYRIQGEKLVIPGYGAFSGSGSIENFDNPNYLRYAYIYPEVVLKNVRIRDFNVTMVFLKNWYSNGTFEKLTNATRTGLEVFAEYTGYRAGGNVWYVQHPYLLNSQVSSIENAVYLKRYLDYGSLSDVLYEDWLVWSGKVLPLRLVNFLSMWEVFVSMKRINPDYAREFLNSMDSYALRYTSNVTLAQALSGAVHEQGGVIFGRGFFVLRSLSSIIGNESMLRAYRLIFKTYGGTQNVSVTNLERIFENVSGEKLGWFFDEWFNTNLVPSYSVRDLRLENSSTYRLTFKLVDSSGFTMPVEVAVYDSNGTIIGKETVWVMKGLGRAVFSLKERPTKVVVDPGDFILNPKVQTTIEGISVFIN
ncbi:hypothetical protein [Thermococcus sp.]